MSDGDAILAELLALSGLSAGSSRLEQALTHPSHANESPGSADNQRLEFLGDAILGLCASELIYRSFPDADEGTLTRVRAQVVNAEALADWARSVELEKLVRLGRGAVAGGLSTSTNVLADTVEALIAAAYLEAGLEGARSLCGAVVQHGLASVSSAAARDAKSELQVRLQALARPVPAYELLSTSGPGHERWFRVRVVGVGVAAEGEGRSRRAAEQAAAAAALSSLSGGTDLKTPEERSEGER